jgi:hypothetical protein
VYSTATVAGVTHNPSYGSGYVGGLIGSQGVSAILTTAYASGNVSGQNYVGGLIGSAGTYDSASHVYATGSVVGQTSVGGLIGASGGSVSYAYATGQVSGYSGGGLIGASGAPFTVSNSYWDKQTTGKAVSYTYDTTTHQGTTTGTGSVGLTTAQMKQASSYSGWSIDNVGGAATTWRIYDGKTYPLLKAFLTPLTATANGSATYNGGTSFALTSASFQYGAGALPGQVLVNSATFVTPSRNVGTYSLGAVAYASDFYSPQQGHDLSVTVGNFTVTAAPITVSTPSVTKTYDATTNAAGSLIVTSGQLFGGDSLSGGSFAFTNANAGSGNKTVTVGGVTVNDGNSGANYAVTYASNTTSTINRAALALNAITDSKTYDGSTSSDEAVSVTGLLGSDSVSALTQSFASKNVLGANGSTLQVNGGYAVNDGNGGGNYNISTNTAAGTITPATLTYVASSASRAYGDANPALSGTVTGFVGGETLGTATTGTAEFGTAATTASNVGSYAISGSGLTANHGNYSFVQAGGNASALSITARALLLAAVTDTKTYDATTSSDETVSVTGLVNGDTVTGLSQSFLSKNVLGAGGSTLQVNGGYAVNDGNSGLNYAVSSNTAAGTINPATLTVTAADATREAGAADPAFTASFDGFVAAEDTAALAGSLVFSTDATAASGAGTYAITPAGLSSGNYAIAFVEGTLTITGAIDTGNDGIHGAQGNAWAYGHDNGNSGGGNDGGKHCNNGGDVNSCNNGDRGHNIYISNGGDVPGSNGSLMRVEEDGLRLPQGV